MKKILILLLVVVLAIPTIAQDKSTVSSEKNVLKVNTLSLFLGTGSVFYERKISNMTSAQLGVGYLNFKFSNTKFTGLILTPEFRIYPKKGAIDGFYLAPYFRYQKYTLENTTDNSKGSLTSMGGGLVFGRQWITNSGFTMDLFFGGHYGSADVKVDSGAGSFDKTNLFEGFKMRVGFALGFAF
ncbi:MAG: DUF3575 domain-containing protein [Bacteroidales bacterium]|nr:DUF3575 domain-containing protein [Bacteroidales bacterium]